MNAQEAKRRVKSALRALPGVVGIGVGLLRDRRVGIVVQVIGEGQEVVETVTKNFPGGCVAQFPIEVSRQGAPVLAGQRR